MKNKKDKNSVLFGTAKSLIKDYVRFIDKAKTVNDIALLQEYPDLANIANKDDYFELFKEGLSTALRINSTGTKFSLKTQQFIASGITAILLKNGAYSLSVFNRYALFTLSERIFVRVLSEVEVTEANKQE